jgi:hypothetical protein
MPSTVIRRIDYDPPSRTLFVRFVSGALYAYRDVPSAVYEAFRTAGSKGAFFSSHIRDRYRYSLIERLAG